MAPVKLNLCIPGLACRTIFFDCDQPTEKVLARVADSLEFDGYEMYEGRRRNLRARIEGARRNHCRPGA